MLAHSDAVLAEVTGSGRRELFHYTNVWRLGVMASLFSGRGAKQVIADLQPKMLSYMCRGQALHVLLQYFREREMDLGLAFRRASILSGRIMQWKSCLDLFGKLEGSMKRLNALNLFHWNGSVYQQKSKGDEDEKKTDVKIKVSVILSGLPYVVGYSDSILLEVEQGQFNPLRVKVLRHLLSSDANRDFPHIDYFGRVGMWLISDHVWVGAATVMENVCRVIGRTTTSTGLGRTDYRDEHSFGNREALCDHVTGMLKYSTEEHLRETIKKRSDSQETINYLSMLVCVQVCAFPPLFPTLVVCDRQRL